MFLMSRSKLPDLDDARAFIEASRWRFARSLPVLPHEYTLREWHVEAATEPHFLAFVESIRTHGYRQRFGSRRILTYWQVDSWRYWVMSPPEVPLAEVLERTTLINRAEVDENGRPSKGPKWLRNPKPLEDAAQLQLEVNA
jgi:hypothetical protein